MGYLATSASEDTLVDGVFEFCAVLEALIGFFGEQAHHDGDEGSRDGRMVFARIGGFLGEDGLEHLDIAACFEGLLPGDEFVEDDTESKDIVPPIDGVAHQILGRHIRNFAFQDTRLGLFASFFAGDSGFGDAKVKNFGDAFVGDHDIGEADIAVDQTERGVGLGVEVLVGVMESSGGLSDDMGGVERGCFFAFAFDLVEDLAEIVAFDKLHSDEVGLADLAEIVDLDDVGVIEHRGKSSFVEEHLDKFGIIGAVR